MLRGLLAAGLLGGSLACGEGTRAARGWSPATDDLAPPTARTELVASLREDLAATRHASDGGGHVRLLLQAGDDGSVPAGGSRSWTLEYEAGPLGVAEGGTIFFQAPPFWGWSTPQPEEPGALGYTTVECSAADVMLAPFTADVTLLGIDIGGRALAAGESVRVVYGAGPAGARTDAFRDGESRFRFAVDGDGDGVRALVPDAPSVRVLPGPPAQLLLHLDSAARPDGSAHLRVAVLDDGGNDGVAFEGRLDLQYDEGLEGPATLELSAGDLGCAEVELQARMPGLWRVRAQGAGLQQAESNPLQAAPQGRRVLWVDLHGHSGLSDGTGAPEDWWRYARRAAGLDGAALTDHDHWGQPFLDAAPELWERLGAAARAADEPGRFVALIAYEWTSWIHGHRHVVSFEDELPLLSSLTLDARHETPRQLWDALDGRRVLTFTHHTAGGPIACNWSFEPDPRFEPVTEIMSVHGSSEAADSPRRIYDPVAGHTARDALDAGYRLGFVGSGDSHDGHPGLAHLRNPAGHGGLAAVLAEECTRDGVYEALRARRCYATSGPRILLRASLDGAAMGSDVPPGTYALAVLAAGTDVLARLELVRSGAVVEALDGDGTREASHVFSVPGLQAGEYVYVRVVQRDSHLAWSSPFFVR